MDITEEQFNKLVTKDEFGKLETRVGKLEIKVDKMLIDVLATKEDVGKLDKKIDTLEGKVDRMLGMMEASAKKDENHEQEHTANIAAHDRFEANFALVKEKKFEEVTAMAMKG